MTKSGKYVWINMPPQKPWYFMLPNENDAGYIYDLFKNWCRIFLCNPISRDWKQLLKPLNDEPSQYSALALSVDRHSHDYIVTLVKSNPLPDEFFHWDFTIQIYDSKSCFWRVVSFNEVLVGWRGGNESVICNGILYFLIHSLSESNRHRIGLIMYDIDSKSSCKSLMETMVMAPSPLACGRLMNLKDRLVLIGEIRDPEKPDVLEGICVWELHRKEQKEVTRMPEKFLSHFGRFEDTFDSSGVEDLIFIHAYGTPTLFIFDMRDKHWRLSKSYPIKKRSYLRTFVGFCFEPRLEIKPRTI
ncbi:F-box/kelch-repeat protein At3g61590-like [Phalaenopsis equestris]|uniref:F-box/kelch-repeat protein At3g61590-like n=1 Tax=Phalaenopsis equestris TaxID=78828 RepID=UPI0009E20D82|nr:F-box/kelch-repeat protein At3g61590-like [Phalaenopsis equestris]